MSKKRIVIGFLPGVVAGLAAVLLMSGVASSRTLTFQAGCNGTWFDANPVSRDTARDYAYGAVYEGYQWGGGCWNYDNIDSAPNDPPQQYTGGEGGDCSGFTFKSWWEKSETGDAGFRYHMRSNSCTGRTTRMGSRTATVHRTSRSPNRRRSTWTRSRRRATSA